MTVPLPVTQATLDAAVQSAVALIAAELWHDSNPGYAIRDCDAWRECEGIARRGVTAALPVLAAAIGQARADEREQCARRLEVTYGYRCPECGGKAGFTAAASGRTWSGCGAGHTWTPPSAPLDVHKAAAIARAGTSGGGS